MGNFVAINKQDNLIRAFVWKANSSDAQVEIHNREPIRETQFVFRGVDFFFPLPAIVQAKHAQLTEPLSLRIREHGKYRESLRIGRKLFDRQPCENADRRRTVRILVDYYAVAQQKSNCDRLGRHACTSRKRRDFPLVIIARKATIICKQRLLIFFLRHFRPGHDLLLHVAGHDVVVAEFHRVRALPLRDAAELGGVAGHFRQRGLALDDGQVARQRFLVFDACPLGVQVAEDGARCTSKDTVTSRLTIGSSSTGRARRKAFLKAIRPAVLNAASELSTGWSLPK